MRRSGIPESGIGHLESKILDLRCPNGEASASGSEISDARFPMPDFKIWGGWYD